ncbi:MAG TPA: winged helix DNA-binding domain-containing protein [Gaiella sp.]|nr:winged helix DNA-binding domain-containing protein [Gaiella sp.]
MSEVLTQRALGRATLARQLLLRRSPLSALEAVEHLVGLQAQVPRDPYVALRARLDGFRPEQLSELFLARKVVRISVMRATIHLVSAGDCLRLRPLMQPVLDAELARHPEYSPALDGVDLRRVLEVGRQALSERPLSGTELRAFLVERFPGRNAAALAYACRCKLPLVQAPPRGLWGRSAQVTNITAEAWLGRPLEERPLLDDVVLRYLAAFGPATVADVTTWCRLTGMREIVERLRPRLRTFRDENGRELFDRPDAPRPDPATPAPTRFLPEYDNVLLSHADRSRFVTDGARERRRRITGRIQGTVLYDGRLAGVWRLDREGPAAQLVVTPLERPTERATDSIVAEGRRLLRLIAADDDRRDLRIETFEP